VKRLIVLFILVTLFGSLNAQRTLIRGRIYAEETREPLAFANFYLGTTAKGFYSDFEGNFLYQTDTLFSDTLRVEYMGYATQFFHIRKDTINNFEIEAKRFFQKTGDVVIKLKINPALKWIKLAQDNRNKNNPDKLPFYNCEYYTNSTVAINNINEKLKKGKIGKEIGSLFDTISYVSGDKSKSILPIFMSEVISDYSFKRNPYLTKEVIKATRVKGIGVEDGSVISQFLGTSFINYNFYQNTLTVIDKGIMSPISESSMIIYDFKLVNVDHAGPRRIFQIYCEPKNSKDLAFKGFVWIEDTTGALVRLSLELNANSNLNYIEKLRITQEYAPTDKEAYFCISTRAVIDAAELNTNMAGIIAVLTNTARNLDTDTDHPPKFYVTRVVMDPDATHKPDSFWEKHRHYPMNPAEVRILSKIDTLVNLKSVRTSVDFVNFIVDGYKKTNVLDIGPYYSLVSYNQLEGVRLRLGFRSSVQLSRNWLNEGFIAYGLKDQKWKYSISLQRIVNRKRWTKVGFLYRRDVEQIGISDNENYSTGIFTAFNMLGSNKLNMNRDTRLWFGTDIRNGLRVTMTLGNRYYQFQKIGNYDFAWYPKLPDTTIYRKDFTNSALTLSVRYSPRNYYVQNDNRRVNLGVSGAEWYGTIIRGFKNILNSDFKYTRIILGVTYSKVWGALGRSVANVEFARVIGNVPYPLLNVYIGNQSFVYNTGAYNQMRIFEFITDKSASFSFEHHLNGFIFNRIPLIRRLKWREIAGTKLIYGNLNKKNFDLIPKQIGDANITQFQTFHAAPYSEISVGIENIFKIIRIDAVWRLTYRNNPRARNFGVKASISLAF